jgi:hypothetical protein
VRAAAQRVVVFDKDLCSLATDLLDTLRAASAIGITAPHLGILKRLVVIELAAADGVRTYVNPQIVWASADMIRHDGHGVRSLSLRPAWRRCLLSRSQPRRRLSRVEKSMKGNRTKRALRPINRETACNIDIYIIYNTAVIVNLINRMLQPCSRRSEPSRRR